MQRHTIALKYADRKDAEAGAPSLDLAWKLREQSNWAEAEAACRSILSAHPANAQAHHLLGLLAWDQNRTTEAILECERAIDIEPHQPIFHNNLGVVMLSQDRYDMAADHFNTALSLHPGYSDARSNLGLALFRQGRLQAAARCFEEAFSTAPDSAAVLANLGMTRMAQQDMHGAVDAYAKALAMEPQQPKWQGNLGVAHLRLSHFDEAARCFQRAYEQDNRNFDYLISRSIALRALDDLNGSIRLLEHILSKDPGSTKAIVNLVIALEYTCQWDKLELFHPLLDQVTAQALDSGRLPDEDPMQHIRRCDRPEENQAVSRAWSSHFQSHADRLGQGFVFGDRSGTEVPITLGYLSHDFRNHPVAHQLYPLFRMHDRRRFRVICFSTGPDDGSRYRREVIDGSDAFVDISALSLTDGARCIYDHKVDILVDLMGHSHHNRMEILALRPAPIQVGYLGFLSTTGANYMDYLVADHVVVPKSHEPYFDEKLIRLPQCYQMTHGELIDSAPLSCKADWGLPASGFVFCCFNAAYKIDRALFDTWLRILLRAPNSVLWLRSGHSLACENMRRRAEHLGVDPNRLVFADKVPLETHLNRLPHADLALDTIRYNGGATTANALAATVPVITILGRHWVSRMTASQLTAAGLPNLIFDSLHSYERAAVEYACHPERLKSVKQQLLRNKERGHQSEARPFVRDLESGYESIWRRYTHHQEPDHIDIPST